MPKSHIFRFPGVIYNRCWGLLAFVVLLSIVSCKNNAEIEQDTLYGKWDIFRAQRNGNETHYLRGGYVIIDKNGTMAVNLTGAEEKGPYTIKDKTIRVSNSKEFLIVSLNPDSMTMRYIMSPESDFLIQLVKHKDEVQ